jgi:Aspartyl protease
MLMGAIHKVAARSHGLVLTCFGTLLLCVISCSTALCAEARFSSRKSVLAIPFELDNNLIYVRVSVNGSRPLSFILDTGAHSIIHARLARSLGLKLKLIGQAEGIGANQPDVYLVMEKVSFNLPGVVLSPRRLVAVSLDAVETCVNEFIIDEEGRNIPFEKGKRRGAKRDVDGILGREFFDQFVVEIDYAQRLLNVYDPSSYKYAGSGKDIPLEVGEQHIFAQARIRAAGRAPLTGRFLLDTGSAEAVSLMKPYMYQHNLLPSTEGMTSLPVCGLGGYEKEKSWIGTLEALQLGEFTVAVPVTEFRLSDPNTDADGFIGGAVFRRFKVIFDYSRRRMILEPRSDLK